MTIHNWQRSIQECLDIISKSSHNAFTHVNNITIKESGKLKNLPIAIKANICTSDLPTTCASAALMDFLPREDALVVQRLRKEGAFIIGKTNMDEFGMGSSSVFSAHGPVTNPAYNDVQRVAGGSSGGAAAAVAMGACFASIGSDTGGSVRLPASYCQVVGFKPTYGAIPRTGLVAYASSLDTVGIIANQVDHVKAVFDIVKGKSMCDMTSRNVQDYELPLRLKIGVPSEYSIEGISDQVLEAWSNALYSLEEIKAQVVPVSLPHTNLALSCYYTIALAEASSNLARYDGLRFGNCAILMNEGTKFENLSNITDYRNHVFGTEVKKRILLGTFILQADEYQSYFLKAQQVRRLIETDFTNIYQENNVDAIITPVSAHNIPPLLDLHLTRKNDYLNDIMTVPSSLAGLPSIVIPFGPEKVGIQIIGAAGKDQLILKLAKLLEQMNQD